MIIDKELLYQLIMQFHLTKTNWRCQAIFFIKLCKFLPYFFLNFRIQKFRRNLVWNKVINKDGCFYREVKMISTDRFDTKSIEANKKSSVNILSRPFFRCNRVGHRINPHPCLLFRYYFSNDSLLLEKRGKEE